MSYYTYCLVGPSGVGKTSVANYLCEKWGLTSISSYTTRPERYPGEKGHIFVSKEEFDQHEMVAYSNYNGYEYGTTKEDVLTNDIYVVDPPGLNDLLNDPRVSDRIVSIYLHASPFELRRRMEKRGDSEAEITRRIALDTKHFRNVSSRCDFSIRCTQIESTAKTIYDFIQYKERAVKDNL